MKNVIDINKYMFFMYLLNSSLRLSQNIYQLHNFLAKSCLTFPAGI